MFLVVLWKEESLEAPNSSATFMMHNRELECTSPAVSIVMIP